VPAEAGRLVEATLDHLERQEVLALLAEDPPEPLDVGVVELAVARRGALGTDQPLALEEADLRDRDVGELDDEQVEDFADRQVRALGHRADPHRVDPTWSTPRPRLNARLPRRTRA
jgi:hypothetical protein